ncbi:MAG: copper chaperone PCu(A)C [Balneolaceae bacterium]
MDRKIGTDNNIHRSHPALQLIPRKVIPVLLGMLFAGWIMSGCNPESSREGSDDLIAGEGIVVEGAWARPGMEGRMSAAYFLITNFETEADTLLSLSSDAARMAEIHESYEQEEGMTGMREAGEVEIPGQSTIRLQPGGLHVMLMQLARDLQEGDEIELILRFARQGEKRITVPVQS